MCQREMNVIFNIKDPAVLEARQLVEQVRSLISDLLLHIFSSNMKKEFLAFLMILVRMNETASSVELLAYANRERDASILILNLMELRFDVLYMVEDLSRTEIWIKHKKENRKPWKVKDQIKELFPDKKERDAEFSLYRRCSMVKHGNPRGGNESFRLGIEGNRVVLAPKCDPKETLNYILWCCSECTQVVSASIGVFREKGASMAEFEKRLTEIEELRLSIFKKNIKAMVLQLNAKQYLDE